MKIEITSPSKAYVDASMEELDHLRKLLSYTNTANQHLVKRHYNNHWARSANPTRWEITLNALKASVHKMLVFEDERGIYIRPGSIPYLQDSGLLSIESTNQIVYPTPKKVAWLKPLPFELYPYQEKSWENLLLVKHGNVELCTGAGKSAILLKLCRETGFRTAIIAPSKSIFLELVAAFERHFGRAMVGKFGDGKKVLGKRFTVCIADSICNIKPDTEEWEFFSSLDMFLGDESHTWGAETLEANCYGVLADVPYRIFTSGTQTRGDGAEKLLQSIIGKTVHTLTTREAVAGGYICPHEYRIISVDSSDPNFQSPDAIAMKRTHFLGNRNICNFIAKVAIAEARTTRRQTLVLVDELSQIAMLLPILVAAGIPTALAHSEKKAERLQELGISKVDNAESVEQFNKGEALVLIGTSCISTGTNIYPTHNTFNWQGGTSEIKTKQGAVGRTVRLGKHNPWADQCVAKERGLIWDFLVEDVYIMSKQLNDRIEHYSDSGSEIKYIKLKK